MGKRREMSTEINASSMADIAFLLLVFFLVTTTMDTSWGISRKLPPKQEDVPEPEEIKMRNVFEVLANSNDQLLVEGQPMDISQLRDAAIEHIVNPSNSETLPESEPVTVAIAKANIASYTASGDTKKVEKWNKLLAAAKIVGPFKNSKQVISLQNDRGTSYNLYIQLQNELAAAYRILRDKKSMELFNMTYAELKEKADNKEKPDPIAKKNMKAIKTVYPQRISEAEPNAQP